MFQDFFRTALQSSLEACLRSGSRTRSSSSQNQMELTSELPPPRRDPAPCENCSLLLRRVQDLEQHLFRAATGPGREGVEAGVQPGLDQNQQSSEEERPAGESQRSEELHRGVFRF